MSKKNAKPQKKSVIQPVSELLSRIIHFVSYDIWRITENEVSGLKRSYIFVAKTVILAVRGFRREDLQRGASALTYNTLLAIVPLLAVIVGIASGFGLRDTVRESVYSYFPGNQAELEQAFSFADNYLSMSKGGIFLGVGVLLLLYTVVNLISTIEGTFNGVWQVNKNRSWHRKITDYLALLILIPAMMTVSSGLSLFISTQSSSFLKEYVFLTPVANSILKISPYIITVLFFTALYILVPNTKVRFWNALAAGIITGCAFQIFQFVYISGQIWVSKYNAIYGSFAALPLLLLWLQLSWTLCLFGAEITYSSQNVKKFSFERDSKNISRRYKDFLVVLITSMIVKRFERAEKPYTADELSDDNRIPIRLATEILYLLTEIRVISEVSVAADRDERVVRYQPALDISKINVGFLLRKIDEYGSENFKIDTERSFRNEWQVMLKTRRDMFEPSSEVLLKDI
ncbi:MAG: YihY/virulence factor BrkB family protein [Tannerella sp.]|jgi:membrane protein|nr:YihY/virulence factor BrkB family protein [Tannerella sp.]